MYYVNNGDPLCPKQNKVLEEQAIWRGTNCYVKISHQFESFSSLHGSTVS